MAGESLRVTDQSKNPVLKVKLVLVVYGALTVVAVAWGWLRGDPNVFVLQGAPWWRAESVWVGYLAAMGAGVGAGLFVVILSRLGTRYLEGLRRMEQGFADVLGNLGTAQIFAAAAASAIGEEALFRGVLLPSTGIWISSAIFGLLHMAPDPRLRTWPLLAFAMGLGFGAMALSFGNLIAPIAAHFVINFLNLRSIAKKAEQTGGRPGGEGPEGRWPQGAGTGAGSGAGSMDSEPGGSSPLGGPLDQ